MSLNENQQISHISDSQIIQVNGNLNYSGLSKEQIESICLHTIKLELEKLSEEAYKEANQRFKDFTDGLISQILSLSDTLFSKFREPSIQLIINKALSGYISSGDNDLKESLIDLMIQRLKVDEKTTEQLLIDEAINILPKLTQNGVALLTIFVFTKTILPFYKKEYLEALRDMGPVANKLKDIQAIDIEYLKQIGCGKSLVGFMVNESLEESYAKNLDLCFSHAFSNDAFNRFLQSQPNIANNKERELGVIFSAVEQSRDRNKLEFKALGMGVIKEVLEKNGKSYILPLIEELKKVATPYTNDEIKQTFININSGWEYAFNLFNKGSMKSFIINPVGVYIGIRCITKILKRKIDLPLSLYYK